MAAAQREVLAPALPAPENADRRRRVTPEVGKPGDQLCGCLALPPPLATTDQGFSNWVTVRPLPVPPRGHSCVLRPFHRSQLGAGVLLCSLQDGLAHVAGAEVEDFAGGSAPRGST